MCRGKSTAACGKNKPVSTPRGGGRKRNRAFGAFFHKRICGFLQINLGRAVVFRKKKIPKPVGGHTQGARPRWFLGPTGGGPKGLNGTVKGISRELFGRGSTPRGAGGGPHRGVIGEMFPGGPQGA